MTGGGGGNGLLNVVPGLPFKGLLGTGEGRKRSNTSERERGLGGDNEDGGRRLAKVDFPATGGPAASS